MPAIKVAIDAGYRHIDCALIYKNEEEIGKAICEKILEGVVKRDELFITSKLWNTHHSLDLVKDAYLLSCKNLNLTFLDAYIMNWPTAYSDCDGLQPKDSSGKIMYANIPFTDTWKAMEKLVEKEMVKSIGISNFSCRQVDHLLNNCRIKPQVHQVECHPFLRQRKITLFCESRGIVIAAYSPLGSSRDIEYIVDEAPVVLENEDIKTIADKYKKPPASIAIRYLLQRGFIVIPKSTNEEHILSNIDVWDFALDKEDMAMIKSISTKYRFHTYFWIEDHPDYPFTVPVEKVDKRKGKLTTPLPRLS